MWLIEIRGKELRSKFKFPYNILFLSLSVFVFLVILLSCSCVNRLARRRYSPKIQFVFEFCCLTYVITLFIRDCLLLNISTILKRDEHFSKYGYRPSSTPFKH